ncbi:DciA family protein [Aliidiomarina sp. Khilg15.8]
MVRRPTKDLRQLLQQSKLGGMQQRTAQFQHWQQLWQEALPADLAPFCKCTAVSDGVIKVSIASAAWLPRLRMLESHLIDYFNQYLEQPVHSCTFKVDPGVHQRR